MTELSEQLSPIVASALRIVSATAAQGTEVVAKELGECLRALGARAPDRSIVEHHLASATVQASALIAAGVLPIDVAPPLARARNLVLDAPSTAKRLGDEPFAADREEKFLLAARDEPALHHVLRSPPPPGGGGDQEAATADAPEPAPEEGAPEGDDDADVPFDVEPPQLEWLDAPRQPYVPPLPLPAIRLGDGGEKRPLREFYRGVVHSALEITAMLARHNADRPQRDRKESEARILCLTDAAIASGDECANDCLSWWSALESPDPWKPWAPAFVLGSTAGSDTLVSVQRKLESMGDKPVGAGLVVAEALAVSQHPDVPRLARELLASRNPIARAAGIELATLRSVLSAQDLILHLCDANGAVLRAALRAVPRVPESQSLVQYVLPLMHYPDRTIAWEVARALALWGRAEPYRDVANRGKLARILGPLALELLVLYGAEHDLQLFEAVLKSIEVTPSHLSCVARFGHPLSWSFLLHFLADDDFVDAAVDALVTLFGPLVGNDPKQRKSVSAWRDAIARARLDPVKRYAGGQPWSPQRLIEECRGGRLSRYEVEKRVDELVVRLRKPHRVDMALWSHRHESQLASVAADITAHHRGWAPGSWECASRV